MSISVFAEVTAGARRWCRLRQPDHRCLCLCLCLRLRRRRRRRGRRPSWWSTRPGGGGRRVIGDIDSGGPRQVPSMKWAMLPGVGRRRPSRTASGEEAAGGGGFPEAELHGPDVPGGSAPAAGGAGDEGGDQRQAGGGAAGDPQWHLDRGPLADPQVRRDVPRDRPGVGRDPFLGKGHLRPGALRVLPAERDRIRRRSRGAPRPVLPLASAATGLAADSSSPPDGRFR